MEVETEAKVDEPFEQVEVKPLDNVPAKVKKDINADVIGYRLFEQVDLQ